MELKVCLCVCDCDYVVLFDILKPSTITKKLTASPLVITGNQWLSRLVLKCTEPCFSVCVVPLYSTYVH